LEETNFVCVWVEVEETRCQTVRDFCESVKTENSCNSLGVVSNKNCTWIKELNDIKCQEIKDRCEEIIVGEEICETPGVGKGKECIWIEGEDVKCQELKETCESIITEPSCIYFNTEKIDQQSLLCVWVKSEDVKCQTKHESCGTIMNRNLCESLGISLSGECFWLEQNGSQPEQQCVEKVLLNPFSLLILLFFFICRNSLNVKIL
jgi:hypothetical protein